MTRWRWFLWVGLGLPFVLAADAPVGPSFDLKGFIDLLLGPVGMSVLALTLLYVFATDRVRSSRRADTEKADLNARWKDQYDAMGVQWSARYEQMKADREAAEKDRDDALALARVSADGYKAVAEGITERNRLEAQRLRQLSREQAKNVKEDRALTRTGRTAT